MNSVNVTIAARVRRADGVVLQRTSRACPTVCTSCRHQRNDNTREGSCQSEFLNLFYCTLRNAMSPWRKLLYSLSKNAVFGDVQSTVTSNRNTLL